jgi:hypothetical protein
MNDSNLLSANFSIKKVKKINKIVEIEKSINLALDVLQNTSLIFSKSCGLLEISLVEDISNAYATINVKYAINAVT